MIWPNQRAVTSCGSSYPPWDGDHVALGDLHALADGLGDLARLADARADAPVHVADHDQRAERELAAALDHLGHAVDADDAIGQLRALAA
jgi:Flp pilus assembly protein TadD